MAKGETGVTEQEWRTAAFSRWRGNSQAFGELYDLCLHFERALSVLKETASQQALTIAGQEQELGLLRVRTSELRIFHAELEALKRDGQWKGQAELMGELMALVSENQSLKERLLQVKAWLAALRTTLDELGE